TALEAGAHLAHVVLEAPQAGDGALVDLLAAAVDARLGAAPHHAVQDVRAGDVAGARHVDDRAHLGAAEGALLVLGLDLAADHLLHVLDEVVDDAVALHGDAAALGRLDHAAGRRDAERQHRGPGRAGQQQVGLGGGAHLGQHDLDVHLVGRLGLALEDALDGLERALRVGAQQQVDGLRLRLAEEVGEGDALLADLLPALLLALLAALRGDALGLDLVGDT